MTEMMPAHVRAAKALLGWSNDELALRSGISRSSLNKLINAQDEDEISISVAMARRVRRALESAGIALLADGTKIGVMWDQTVKPPPKPDGVPPDQDEL